MKIGLNTLNSVSLLQTLWSKNPIDLQLGAGSRSNSARLGRGVLELQHWAARWFAALLILAGSASLLLAGPTVTMHPPDKSLNDGQTVIFTAVASGIAPLTASWETSTDGGVTFTALSGTTTTSSSSPIFTSHPFTVSPNENGHQYRAVFSDSSGSTASSAATLTVFAYVLDFGRIEVDFMLEGGSPPLNPTPSQAAFHQFYNINNTAEHVRDVVGQHDGIGSLIDGSVNIEARSPVRLPTAAGESYPDRCNLPSQQFTWPFLNLHRSCTGQSPRFGIG